MSGLPGPGGVHRLRRDRPPRGGNLGWVAADRPRDRAKAVSAGRHDGSVTVEVNLNLELEVVAAVCRAATGFVGGHRSDVDVDVVVDPLDATMWVHLPTSAVHRAVAGLRARGLDAAAVNDHRVHVTGWEVRLLRWRLGVLLAGIDTLTAYPDLTADLIGYHHDRDTTARGDIEAWAVLADVEAALRAATPLPHPPPHVGDLLGLLGLVAAAEDATNG